MSNNTNFKKTAITLAITASVLVTAGAATANSGNPFASNIQQTTGNNNPFVLNAQPNVEDVKQNRLGVNSTTANKSGVVNNATAVSSPRHPQAPDSTSTQNDGVVPAVQACVMADHAEEVQIAKIQAIEASPTRTAAMESIEKQEATKGCLSSSKEILDLTLALPTIRGSWGDIGNIVRRQVDKEISKIKESVINRACEIADKAIYDATRPVHDFYKKWTNAVEIINHGDAYVGKYVTNQISLGSNKVGRYLDQRMNTTARELDEAGQRVNNAYSKVIDKVEQATNNPVIDFTIQDPTAEIANIRKQNVQAALNEVRSNIPQKPQNTVQASRGEYQLCDLNRRNCKQTSFKTYNEVRKQHADYNEAMRTYGTQLQMLERQLHEINTGNINTPVRNNQNTSRQIQTSELVQTPNNTPAPVVNNQAQNSTQTQTTAPVINQSRSVQPTPTPIQNNNQAKTNNQSTNTGLNPFRSGTNQTASDNTKNSNNPFAR